jgi:uncharacterized protein YukE
MGGSYDARMLEQQNKLDAQQAARNAALYNPDGSAKADDYRPPRLPESSFPGLVGGTELTVNRDGLNQVAAAMQSDLDLLQQTLQQFDGSGWGGEMIDGWPTATAFGSNAGNAYDGISTFYGELNTAYDMVIDNVQQTARNYADAESATEGAARGVGGEVTGG